MGLGFGSGGSGDGSGVGAGGSGSGTGGAGGPGVGSGGRGSGAGVWDRVMLRTYPGAQEHARGYRSDYALIDQPPPPPPLPPASEFVRTVDNPWFPLLPGTVLTYRGHDEGTPARDVFRVTHDTKLIEGVRATVVDDRVYKRGRLAERTKDYYAQDRDGNVWYLGEDTATIKHNGQVESREGTFRAGRDGARAGIFMPAHPRPGTSGWQEYYVGHAQDRFKVLDLHTRVRTPAVSSRRAMLVRETTPLEPGVLDHKVYVRGIGTVVEKTIRGGSESFRLVRIRRP